LWIERNDAIEGRWETLRCAQGDNYELSSLNVSIRGLSWEPGGPCMSLTGPHSPPRRVTMKVTPTGHVASGLSSWLRVMSMRAGNGVSQNNLDIGTATGADKSAVGAINRPLRLIG
jgi:hypothetical protein